MFNKLIVLFIDDYMNYDNQDVRNKYGILCGIIGVIANIIMAVSKVFFGSLVNSIAIVTDGINNLADVVSNLASLLAFKLSSKHPDSDHPYGHGRFEYIIGLFIGVSICFVGVISIKESITKIINPVSVLLNPEILVVLIASIIIKIWLGFINRKAGNLIKSNTLLAVSKDSFNDVFATIATLIALIFTLFSDFSIDGYLGFLVSIMVIKAGLDVFKDSLDPLLGKAPDQDLIDEVYRYINKFPEVLGIHDFMLHDYGPGRRFMTLHVEVDCRVDMLVTHDVIDLIERKLLEKYHILTTIHMDPIDIHDENTNNVKIIVINVVKSINMLYTIHDFRIVVGVTHTNLVFDILIPIDDKINHNNLKKMVTDELQKINSTYYTVIQIDHSYV